MSRDTTVGATRRRLEDLGYAVTSATHPDRILDPRFHFRVPGRRATFHEIAGHQAAIYCLPTAEQGCELPDASARQVVLLTITDFLLGNSKEAKPVLAVLEKAGLLAGPYLATPYGSHVRPLRYDGAEPVRLTHTRHAHPDDDDCLMFEQAVLVKTTATQVWRDGLPGPVPGVAVHEFQSLLLPVAGDWKN